MSGVAVAIGASALVGAGASVYGASQQAGAASNAANAQETAAQQALAFQEQQWNTTQQNQAPFLQAGQQSINQLAQSYANGGSGPSINQLQLDPGYAFRRQQGTNALAASGAASGNYGSGNMGVALQNYGQNLASEEYQNAYSRWYNPRASMAGIGQQTASNLGQLGVSTGANMGQTAMMGAQNAGYYNMLGADAWSNSINQIGGIGMGGIKAGMQNNSWQNYLNGLNGGGSDYSGYNAVNDATIGGG
jgi:hypothetical protein